jgi:hypothetical protein
MPKGERTKVLPEVKSHTPPITKGNLPGEGKKKKESDFLSDEKGEEKNSELNSERPLYVGKTLYKEIKCFRRVFASIF